MTEKRSGESELQERIRRAREELEPKSGPSVAEKYNALSAAWRMVLELVVGTGIGVAIGWSLDDLFGTNPIFLIVLGLFGFAAGVKTVMSTAKEVSGASKEARGTSDADRARENDGRDGQGEE